MRTCEVLVLNFQFDSLSQGNFRSFFSGFDSRLATRHSPVCVVHGGLAQMVERSLRMRQARGSMPLSSTRATFVAHEHEPPIPGLVSSVGRAHDSYDLRRSHERRRLLRSCGRGFNPRIGCKEFSSWLCGHTTLHEPECRERMPGRPGFESRRGRQTSTLLLTLSLVV